MIDDCTEIPPQRPRRRGAAFRDMIGDGLDRSSVFERISLAYRYAELRVGLLLVVPVVIWLIDVYPTSRYERYDLRIVVAMAFPLIAALIERRMGIVRRWLHRLRRWVDSFGTVRRR